jgi:hypothetical protein
VCEEGGEWGRGEENIQYKEPIGRYIRSTAMTPGICQINFKTFKVIGAEGVGAWR